MSKFLDYEGLAYFKEKLDFEINNKVSIKSVGYQEGSSPTSPPAGSWSGDVVPVDNGKYLWTKFTYQNDETAYTVAKQGENGVDISKIEEFYAVSSDNTNPPADAVFSKTPQLMTTTNKYLWNYELITYSNNRTSSTDKRIIGVYGDKGETGLSGLNTATVFLYKRSSASPTKPSSTLIYNFTTGILTGTLSGWSQDIPTSDGTPCWVIQATAISNTETDEIASSEWSIVKKLVDDGLTGSSTAVVYLYKRSSTSVSIDWTNTLTYDFTTLKLTSVPTGWSQTIPSGNDPLYVTAATAYSNTTYDTIAYTEWTSPIIFVSNGKDGESITSVVNYYLATPLSSGVTKNTPGWTDTIQSITDVNKYLWNYEVVYSNQTVISETVPCIIGTYGDNGETSTLLRVDSSKGTMFRYNETSTVLNAVIYYGTELINNITDLHRIYGASSYLQWYWQASNSTIWNTIPLNDERISNDGFSLTISIQSVNDKTVFKCDLINPD